LYIIAFLLLSGCWNNDQQQSLSLEYSNGSFSLSREFTPNEFEYACLTHGEYHHPYLAKKYQCYDCQITKEGKTLISRGWKPDQLLLIIKSGKVMDIQNVILKKNVNDFKINTSYKSVSYFPDRYFPFEQCTQKASIKIECFFETNQGCLPLFSAKSN